MLDIFNNDAFSVTTLTDTINKIKFVPGRIGELNLFTATGVATTSVVIEERNGVLTLVSPSPRGGPGQTILKPLRAARSIRVPHFEINDAIMAEEVQGVRAWGQETAVQTVQTLVADRLAIHSQSMGMTQEFSRIGAIKGLVTYADGSTLDLIDEFKVSAPSEVFLDLANVDPTPGVLRRACAGIARTVASQLGGIPLQSLYAFCGDDFFDDLVSHPEVRETYLGWLAAQELRTGFVSGSGLSWGAFPFGGIVWENYRGAVDITPFIDPDLAHVFPVGVPGFFRTYYAPADYIETVNTIGQRLYSKQYPMDNGKGVNLDAQMNALDICTRPNALVKVSRLAS
jgi:hypothetical protein